MGEVWQEVEGYAGLYDVSNLGRIRSWKRRAVHLVRLNIPKILKPYLDPNGYLRVDLYKNKHKSYKRVHHLVAHAFIGPRPGGLEVNHLDLNKQNNKVGNLEYCTGRENVNHWYASEETRSTYPGVGWGGYNWMARIHYKGGYWHICSVSDEKVAAIAYQEMLKYVDKDEEIFRKALKEIHDKYSKPQTSRYRGIHFNKSVRKWKVRVNLKGKRKHIGCYPTEQEACEAQQRFIRLNKVVLPPSYEMWEEFKTCAGGS